MLLYSKCRYSSLLNQLYLLLYFKVGPKTYVAYWCGKVKMLGKTSKNKIPQMFQLPWAAFLCVLPLLSLKNVFLKILGYF